MTEINYNLGPSLPTLLFVVFLTLKLTGYIAWSWVWVFAPLWVPPALFVLLLLVIGIVAMLFGIAGALLK